VKKVFMCSLCRNGILGGALYLSTETLAYKTNKLTVPPEYRNLVMPLQEIQDISWKWIVFPIANVRMSSGETFSFIIFNRSRFEKHFAECRKADR
jgi:hypothetical protein